MSDIAPYLDASYLPVYDLANQYDWVLMFHTGIGFAVRWINRLRL